MDVVSGSGFRVGAVRWQPRGGVFAVSVVATGWFELRPGEASFRPAQGFPFDVVPGEMRGALEGAPFKRRTDVIVTGHAVAENAEPVSSLVARLAVGGIDKAIEVHADRAWMATGRLVVGAPFIRMSLAWERAAAGPQNPVGVVAQRPGAGSGLVPLPNLQPVGVVVRGPADVIAPIGFGAVAPDWPSRAASLGKHAGTWSASSWSLRPLPEDLDGSFFNAAPPDQQLAELRGDELITLEHLHPAHARLSTRLARVVPRAIVQRPGRPDEELGLRCDTLWIDADRGIAVAVWRGVLLLSHAEEPGVVTVKADTAPLGPGDTVPPPRVGAGDTVRPPPVGAGDTTRPPPSGAGDTARPPPPPALATPEREVAWLSPSSPGDAVYTVPLGSFAAPAPTPFVAPDATGIQPAASAAGGEEAASLFGRLTSPDAASRSPFILRRPASPTTEEPASAPPEPPRQKSKLFSDSESTSVITLPRVSADPALPFAKDATSAQPSVPALVATVAAADAAQTLVPGLTGAHVADRPTLPFPDPGSPGLPAPPALLFSTFHAPPALAPSLVLAPPPSPPPAVGSAFADRPPSDDEDVEEEPPTGRRRLAEMEPAAAPPPATLHHAPSASPHDVAPPPMLGPIAVVDRASPAAANTDVPPPPADPAESPAPQIILAQEPEPEPVELSIEQTAAVAAEIAEGRTERGKVLEARGLRERTWRENEARWNKAMERESSRGVHTLRAAHDAAYVARVEGFRGPITVEQYARIVAALERGKAAETLDELHIQRPALLPIVRLWTRKVARDMLLGDAATKALRQARRDA